MAFPRTPWHRRGFSLPRFELAPLEFAADAVELDRNLHSVQDRGRPIDAAAELSQALTELRRSLG